MFASIILPTISSATKLDRTIRAIADQLSPDSELIIVQNVADRGGIRDLVDLLNERFGHVFIRLVYEPTPGLLAGRHRGFHHSHGDLLIFVDDDILVSENWLTSLLRCFDDEEVCLAGGPSTALFENDPPDWLDRFWRTSLDGYRFLPELSLFNAGAGRFDVDPGFLWGLNFAIRKSTLKEVEGFHPDGMPWALRRFRGDGETHVTDAIRSMGKKTIYDAGAMVRHVIPPERLTMEYFQKRFYLQGISDSYTAVRRQHFDCARRPRFIRWFQEIAAGARCLTESIFQISRDDRMTRATKRAYDEGYSYHQHCFRTDPAVREWVLRPDYWQYAFGE